MHKTVSVLIVTKNRPRRLRACVESIRNQIRKPNEVVIVENSQRRTLDWIIKVSKGLKIKYILERVASLAVARNTALRHASGDILACVDDDCVLTPKWVGEVEKTFINNPKVVVLVGRTNNYYSRNVIARSEQVLYERWFESFFDMGKAMELNSGMFLDTKNCAINRSFVDRYGLCFNEYAPFKTEDSSFGINMLEQMDKEKEIFFYNPKCVLFHKNNVGLGEFVKKRFYEGRELNFLHTKFGDYEPIKRRKLPRRYREGVVTGLLLNLARIVHNLGYVMYGVENYLSSFKNFLAAKSHVNLFDK